MRIAPAPAARGNRVRPVRAARAARVVVGALALLVPLGLAPAALAHNSLTGSTPSSGARLTSAPASVTLSFEEPPLAAGLAVTVTASDRSTVTAGRPVLRGSDVVTPLLALTASGTYTVAWRVVADDGHPVTGHYTFDLTLASASGAPQVTTAPPEGPASSSPLPGVSDASSGADLTPWMVGGSVILLVVIVAAGVVSLAARRRSP